MPTSQFTIYSSQHDGAPVLTGQSGSLVTVLDAILVNGYGTMPGAGWTKSFSASNEAVYRMPTGSQFYFNVQDNALVTAKEARIRGFEVATAQDTGSGQFPSQSQAVATNGYVIARKSSTADTTPRVWLAFVESRSLYFFSQTGDAVLTNAYYSFQFGDFYSIKNIAPDPYNCVIHGRSSENATSTAVNSLENLSSLANVLAGMFVARSYTTSGSSINTGKHGDGVKGSNTSLNGTTQYPNMTDNALYMSPLWVVEPATSTIRGRMRGLYQICHPQANFGEGEQFTGSNYFVSKSFYIIPGAVGLFCMETSATIETN